jgi:hypothetical protein
MYQSHYLATYNSRQYPYICVIPVSDSLCLVPSFTNNLAGMVFCGDHISMHM